MSYSNIHLRRENDDTKTMNMLLETVINYAMRRSDPFGAKTVNLNEVISNISEELEHKTGSKSCKLVMTEELPSIPGVSSSLLYQVFENLILNAIKFNTSSAPIIQISSAISSEEYIFSISDNGIGISSINYKTLFTLFDNNNNARLLSGKRVGLALCKKIIEHYGGKIWVESILGEGSTFYFTIKKDQADKNSMNETGFTPYSIESVNFQQRNIA